MPKISEIGGKRVPFLRWSVWRMVLGMRHLTTHWQVGDGREQALADHVTATAAQGDLDDAIRAVDDFCYRESVMMNVGDEKGELLDAAIRRSEPSRLLELGTYCGYSALRTVRVMRDEAHLYSIEFLADNASNTGSRPASTGRGFIAGRGRRSSRWRRMAPKASSGSACRTRSASSPTGSSSPRDIARTWRACPTWPACWTGSRWPTASLS